MIKLSSLRKTFGWLMWNCYHFGERQLIMPEKCSKCVTVLYSSMCRILKETIWYTSITCTRVFIAVPMYNLGAAPSSLPPESLLRRQRSHRHCFTTSYGPWIIADLFNAVLSLNPSAALLTLSVFEKVLKGWVPCCCAGTSCDMGTCHWYYFAKWKHSLLSYVSMAYSHIPLLPTLLYSKLSSSKSNSNSRTSLIANSSGRAEGWSIITAQGRKPPRT